jgi:hypothetical protein
LAIRSQRAIGRPTPPAGPIGKSASAVVARRRRFQYACSRIRVSASSFKEYDIMTVKQLRLTCWTGVVALVALTSAVTALAETVVEPFNGKDLTGWTLRRAQGSQWVVGVAKMDQSKPSQLVVTPAAAGQKGEMVNAKSHSVDISTEQQFGDCTVSLELMVPKGSNSGIYLMGNYEIQVLDSFGKEKVGPGDIGGLYGAAAPRVNAAKAPGEWQHFLIEFQAPKFKDGKKVSNALFKKVTLNGTVIHENVELKGVTGGAMSAEKETGPLMFQGDHGPVAYRNIKITLP